MPKRTTLTERFRRVSTPDVFRRSSKADPALERLVEDSRPLASRSKSVPDGLIARPTTTHLLSLPTEICAQILSYNAFEDLCAFRMVCRATHYLLLEGVILRQWINEHLDRHQLFLHPAPSPPTFVYVAEQHRRSSTVVGTAHVLVEYIEHEILRHTLRRANISTDQYRQGLFGLVKIRLLDKMTPSLFTIQWYLERQAETLLSSGGAHTSGADARSESGLLATLDPSHLLQAHKCFLFLCWLSNQILSRPSYVGSVERTMRGWLSEPLDHFDFRLFLLFGNIGALAQLVRLPSYKHRRKAVEAWIRGLEPGQNVEWREKWRKMGPRLGACPEKESASEVLGLQLSVGSIWIKEARQQLIGKGLLKRDEDTEIGSPWQTMSFLCEIAGYDILHTPPSWSTS